MRRTPPKPKPRVKPNHFQRAVILEAAEGYARKQAPKPSSWWTQHAQPESARAEFVAEVTRRAMAREQKHASSAGIALHRMGPA